MTLHKLRISVTHPLCHNTTAVLIHLCHKSTPPYPSYLHDYFDANPLIFYGLSCLATYNCKYRRFIVQDLLALLI